MDHCSQFFILFLNGITHQNLLPCDFAVPPTRVDREYFYASLVWGLAMRVALANEMWTEMQMCQSQVWSSKASCVFTASLDLLPFAMRKSCFTWPPLCREWGDL